MPTRESSPYFESGLYWFDSYAANYYDSFIPDYKSVIASNSRTCGALVSLRNISVAVNKKTSAQFCRLAVLNASTAVYKNVRTCGALISLRNIGAPASKRISSQASVISVFDSSSATYKNVRTCQALVSFCNISALVSKRVSAQYGVVSIFESSFATRNFSRTCDSFVNLAESSTSVKKSKETCAEFIANSQEAARYTVPVFGSSTCSFFIGYSAYCSTQLVDAIFKGVLVGPSKTKPKPFRKTQAQKDQEIYELVLKEVYNADLKDKKAVAKSITEAIVKDVTYKSEKVDRALLNEMARLKVWLAIQEEKARLEKEDEEAVMWLI